MSPSDSPRFARLWKPVAVYALLLIIAGSLGIYMYAQRQYAVIRATEHRHQRAVLNELRQDLQTLSTQYPTVSLAELFGQPGSGQDRLVRVFQELPALARILVLDGHGYMLFGQERPTFAALFDRPDDSHAEQQAYLNERVPSEFTQTIQLALVWNHQDQCFLRGDFVTTDATASINQLIEITLQIALVAIIAMFGLGVSLIFMQITRHMSSRQRRLEEYVMSLQQSNEQLRRAQKELKISEKLASLGYLAAGVAHEIGNPLAAALGYIELLQKASFPIEKQQDILARTQQEIERIRRIIQELVTFSRPHSMNREIVDVNTLVREVILRVPALPEKALDIQLKLTNFPLWAEIDPQKLQSVLHNILCNAIDAIPRSGQILFSTSRRIHESAVMIGSSEVIAIQCADTGRGIPEDHLVRIFEPFFTTKDPGKGMGLGLPLCHRIIESLHGEIAIESAVDRGTTVTVYLPPAPKPKEA